MTDEQLLKRTSVNPEIFGGKPIIRGMRILVELIFLKPREHSTHIAVWPGSAGYARHD